MKKVLIPTALDAVAKEMLEAHGGYTVLQCPKSDVAELVRANPDTHAILVRSEKITAEIIDSAPALKVIVRAGAGYNTIDIRHARQKGVDVLNTPGANSNAVAEEVIAMILADARHLVEADASCRAGRWEKSRFMGTELTGKTIGIVGLGYIGQLVAKRMSGFEVRVLGYDPFTSEEKAKTLGIELTSLPELFDQADYITLHVPENEETRGMVNRTLLKNMKTGATLVNCARAGILNEEDLRAVKEETQIHFLNDVYPKDAEGDKSVADIADLMLPHLGASTREANRKAAELAARELIDLDDKGITSAVVNRNVPAGLDPAFARLANVLTRICRRVLGVNTRLKLVETSFYGSLKPFADWLLTPVTAALSGEYDTGMDHKRTLGFLADMGVEYVNRSIDDSKAYTNSITIDLTGNVDAEHLMRASVRGTVEEGNLLVARINDFDKLYFEPEGNWVVFIYKDRPGVLGRIAAGLASAGVNIDDVRNPHDSKGHKSLAILKVNRPVNDELVKAISSEIEARIAFHIEL
ncbi:MAG: hypothetical protein LBN38_00030 [Verrucomicrobiota bacterium]|jgi:D-3-phosphoglycerate dehydrogenase|nr:hypothetical protein [Verrucomicrobiota bacterium]